MIRTYKRKLILTKAQEARVRSWIGATRFIYNLSHEIRQETFKATGKSVHKYELMKQLTEIRHIDWIKDVPVGSMQEAIERLDEAYRIFFSGGGFPKFASKRRYNSIAFKYISIKEGEIYLPKIGKVKIFKDAPIIGIPKNAIIKIEPTGFYICVCCNDVPPKIHSENQAIGIDMGVSLFAVDSNGNLIDNPQHFRNYERKLRIENRSLSRKKKGSNSWIRQVKKLSRLHHTIGNVRRDFLHKESTKIAKQYSTVYLEDLNIKGMVRNHKLSKHILDCGWGIFKTMLEYKTNVIKVNPKYTSQQCSECGAVDSKSRLSQSEYCCTSCGFVSNADYNAAKNIIGRGTAISRKRDSLECALALESKSDMSVKIEMCPKQPKEAISATISPNVVQDKGATNKTA